MTINPMYPIVTKGIWLRSWSSAEDMLLRGELAEKVSELASQSKTDGILTRVDIAGSESFYAYRFWSDVETAQDFINYCSIIPAELMQSIGIVDASEVADL
jgi:hypothetical protein